MPTFRDRLRAFAQPSEPIPVPPVIVPGVAPKSTAQLYCEVARARLDDQLAVVSAFDAKATALLTIGSTVLPITAGLLVNGFGSADTPGILRLHPYSQYALELGAAFYVLLVASFLLLIGLGEWDTRPELAQWKELAPQVGEDALLRWLGDACVEAYTRNRPNAERKARYFGLVAVWLGCEVVALIAAILIPLVF